MDLESGDWFEWMYSVAPFEPKEGESERCMERSNVSKLVNAIFISMSLDHYLGNYNDWLQAQLLKS